MVGELEAEVGGAAAGGGEGLGLGLDGWVEVGVLLEDGVEDWEEGWVFGEGLRGGGGWRLWCRWRGIGLVVWSGGGLGCSWGWSQMSGGRTETALVYRCAEGLA